MISSFWYQCAKQLHTQDTPPEEFSLLPDEVTPTETLGVSAFRIQPELKSDQAEMKTPVWVCDDPGVVQPFGFSWPLLPVKTGWALLLIAAG